MSKASKKFFKEIETMAMTGQYDENVVKKILDIVDTSTILADQATDKELIKTLQDISIVGESLAGKLHKLKEGK